MTTKEAIDRLNGFNFSNEQKNALIDIIKQISHIDIPKYEAADKDTLGLVKQANTINPLEENDDIATVITTVNTLISNLKESGVIATK